MSNIDPVRLLKNAFFSFSDNVTITPVSSYFIDKMFYMLEGRRRSENPKEPGGSTLDSGINLGVH